MRRPRGEDLEDPTLCELARKCHQNVALLSGLAGDTTAEYEVETVAGVLYWVIARLGGEDESLNGRETYAKMMQLHIAETQLELGVNLGDVDSGVEDTDDVPRSARKRRAGTTRLRNLKKVKWNWLLYLHDKKIGHAVHLKTRSIMMMIKVYCIHICVVLYAEQISLLIETVMILTLDWLLIFQKRRDSADDWTPGLDDGEDDSDWHPSSRVRSATRILRPRRASLSPTKTYSAEPVADDSDSPADVKTEVGGDGNGDRDKTLTAEKTHRLNPGESDGSDVVKIKDEPVDKGYEGTKSNARRLSDPEPLAPANLIGTLRDVVVHRHLTSQTGLLEKDLQIAQQQNQHLSLCLQESQKSVMSLQGQLAERDILLSGLAEDFFDMKQRFEKMSNRFKLALRGTLQSNINNNGHA